MTSLTPTSRESLLDRLEADRFDVVVIGGGITGAGVARDAAHRGMTVALLETDDFAAGTSSRSSKLIHGGLRYLAMGEVGLVRETALERKAVHRMAPHLAEPCWMVVPARNRASLMKFRAGIDIYEKLGAVVEADRHNSWDRDDIHDHEPILRGDIYPWACAYREYLTDDARLVLAVLRDAAGQGAVIASRAPAVGVLTDGGRVSGVEVRCRKSGRSVPVRGDVVVNAAGPWVEDLARMEAPDAPNRLHLSKGVHVVVPSSRLDVRNLVIMTTADKRSIFAIPKNGFVIIGTTDTSYRGDRPLWPEIDRADVDYLLDPLPHYFDVEPLSAGDVVASWAGVRPLVAQKGKDPKEMSRKEEVWIGPGGMITAAGGKLTGFRAMAVTVMEAVAARLDKQLPPPPEPDPIPGGDITSDLDTLSAEIAAEAGIGRPVVDRLVRLYGSETPAVISLGASPIIADGVVITGEVDWAVTMEAADSLEDVVYRRTRAAWYNPGERHALLAPVATRMAELLGWDHTRVETEIEAVRTRLVDELAFMGDTR